MHVPRTPLLLLVLLAAAHVLGAAAQESQELSMEEPMEVQQSNSTAHESQVQLMDESMQQSNSTAPRQQAGIVITGPSFTLVR